MWLVWQARVKAQTWFDAVLVVVYDCGRQLLAVAESIGCLVGQLLYVYGGYCQRRHGETAAILCFVCCPHCLFVGESDVALLLVIRSCRLWPIDNSGLSVVVCRNRGFVRG